MITKRDFILHGSYFCEKYIYEYEYNDTFIIFIYNYPDNTACNISMKFFCPGPIAFCKKAVERIIKLIINSEKNILNSSMKWSS